MQPEQRVAAVTVTKVTKAGAEQTGDLELCSEAYGETPATAQGKV